MHRLWRRYGQETNYLGPQPPSNRYLWETKESYDTHSIEFCICTSCGLAQLSNPMPSDVVRSCFEWISYNEPEGHFVILCPEARVVGKEDNVSI